MGCSLAVGGVASHRLGWAMVPRLPQRGGWLYCFPKVGDRQMPIGWDKEGWPPPYVFLGGVWKGPPYVFLGGPLPKKRVALREYPA